METQPMFDIPLLDEAAMQLANIKKKGPFWPYSQFQIQVC